MISDCYNTEREYTKRHNDYIKCITSVNPNKLLKNVHMLEYEPWGVNSFTVEDVKDAILSNSNLSECDTRDYDYLTGRDPIHIERILYFVRHPEKIDPIKVGLGVIWEINDDDFVYMVEDGWHRLYAAIILEINIPCYFEGGKIFLESIK